jgi:Fe-S cluster assembly protein SufD
MKKTYYAGNTGWYARMFADYEKSLNGTAATDFHAARRNAIHEFEKTGYPSTKEEEWKYTNVREIADVNFQPLYKMEGNLPAMSDIERQALAEADDFLLTFVDGIFVQELSRYRTGENFPEIIPFGTDGFDEKVLPYLQSGESPEEAGFTMLNTALMNGGVYINIPAGLIVEPKIELLFISRSGMNNILVQPRNVIVAGNSSSVTLIENYVSMESDNTLTNAVSSFLLGNQANVNYYRLQNESLSSYHLGTVKVEQKRDSVFSNYAVSFGAKVARNFIETTMGGENIESHLYGLYAGVGAQHIDNRTTIDHALPHCHSNELYKGVLNDQSRGVFNGKINVRPDAQKTNAIQSNNCILLSKEATVDSKPQLEIYADDVRCTHGATVGQLDENAFFYMRSRGIDKEKARNLLIYAFASEVLESMPDTIIRGKVENMLAQKLQTVKPQ